MAWTKLEESLPTHPKTIYLAELLGLPDPDLAWAKLARLWLWALRYCPHGRLTVGSRPMTDAQIARASNFHGDATVYVRSLLDAGFLDSQQGGQGGRTLQIHDWQDYGGALHAERERERERSDRRRKSGRPAVDRRSTGGRGEERRGEKNREEERGKTPLPGMASPGTAQEETEIELTLSMFDAWSHPPMLKKQEGIRELLSIGISHEHIREAAQLNRPADTDFWGIVKAFKSKNGRGTNGKHVKVPTPVKPEDKSARRSLEPIEAVQARQDEARKKCEAAIQNMDQQILGKWRAEVESREDVKKLPDLMKTQLVETEIRLRVAKEIGVSL